MRLKGVRRAILVATESGTKPLTPPTCAKGHCPATGISHSVGETQVCDCLAHEFRRARTIGMISPRGNQLRLIAHNVAFAAMIVIVLPAAIAQSIPGIVTFAIGTTMANIRWRAKSNFWKTQSSAVSNGPFQEQEQ
jgi:hypothetical protein